MTYIEHIKDVINCCRLKYEFEIKQNDCIIFYSKKADRKLIKEYLNKMFNDTNILRIEHEDFYIINMNRYKIYNERMNFKYMINDNERIGQWKR